MEEHGRSFAVLCTFVSVALETGRAVFVAHLLRAKRLLILSRANWVLSAIAGVFCELWSCSSIGPGTRGVRS